MDPHKQNSTFQWKANDIDNDDPVNKRAGYAFFNASVENLEPKWLRKHRMDNDDDDDGRRC